MTWTTFGRTWHGGRLLRLLVHIGLPNRLILGGQCSVLLQSAESWNHMKVYIGTLARPKRPGPENFLVGFPGWVCEVQTEQDSIHQTVWRHHVVTFS